MKKLIIALSVILLVFPLFLLNACSSGEEGNNDIKIMSYNVRVYSPLTDTGEKDLNQRYPRIKERISDMDPDIICMQEFTSFHMELFNPDYSENYGYVLTYRSQVSIDTLIPEATPIFYKKDKFELLDSGTFWLSETPEVISKGWDASYYRICTWVKLKVKATNKEFYVYNTHLDWGEIAAPSSIALILERMQKDCPCVLTGDMNFTPDTQYYTTMTTALSDSRITATESSMPLNGTTNEYSSDETTKVIDYIFYTKEDFQVNNHVVYNDDYTRWGHFASDHYAVGAFLNFS